MRNPTAVCLTFFTGDCGSFLTTQKILIVHSNVLFVLSVLFIYFLSSLFFLFIFFIS